jgi:hypothetical protein
LVSVLLGFHAATLGLPLGGYISPPTPQSVALSCASCVPAFKHLSGASCAFGLRFASFGSFLASLSAVDSVS